MKTQDLILFILNNCPPNSVGVKKLNKLAFLLEWAYIFDTGKYLTNTKFVALPMGPVIDDYKNVLEEMVQTKLLLQNHNEQNSINYFPISKPKIEDDKESFLSKVLDKYKNQTGLELEHFTHSLHSYIFTIKDNKEKYGKGIKKYLACLEAVLSLDDLFDESEE